MCGILLSGRGRYDELDKQLQCPKNIEPCLGL